MLVYPACKSWVSLYGNASLTRYAANDRYKEKGHWLLPAGSQD